ncbi:hypothetical protein B296_00024608 [Ensete ventricosum]|uniref:Glutamine amidotransferase type-2 domain-containing protein n=1 Tax=Ensete ventricosum TaxID=4639 RepID=A0A427ATA2_ENSVE|nr:hypothetical protein B296_00024608 [Ensete ventricosum]
MSNKTLDKQGRRFLLVSTKNVNGEIYNHEELRKRLPDHKFRTGSDCEVIAHLVITRSTAKDSWICWMGSSHLCCLTRATTASSLLEMPSESLLFTSAGDSTVGDKNTVSCYYGWILSFCSESAAGATGSVWISSEMKGLNDDCEHFEVFPPGHLFSSKGGIYRRWYNPPWYSEAIPSVPYDPLVLREAFEKVKTACRDVLWMSRGSPDLKAAKEVADYLGTVHHEFHFTVQVLWKLFSPRRRTVNVADESLCVFQDGIDAIEDVIYHIETYDVTTIRASTPMFLMSRKIKALGVKMVISGEGSDELFGGYLYFHKAPNKEEFHRETCRKSVALLTCCGVHAQIKPDLGRIEKWVLRKAFDDEENPYLPKREMTDGVDLVQVSGKMMQNAKHIYPHNTPTTKEAYYYRMIFERFFPQVGSHIAAVVKKIAVIRARRTLRCGILSTVLQNSARLTVPGGPSVACSTAKAIEWDAQWSENLDPSGRAALGVHVSAYEPAAVPSSLTTGTGAAMLVNKKQRVMEAKAPELTISS